MGAGCSPAWSAFLLCLDVNAADESNDLQGKLVVPYVRFPSASSVWIRFLILIVFVTKVFEGILLPAWEAMDLLDCRALAKQMRMEKWANDHPSDSDPESMEGYSYLVQFPVPSVTIDQIWNCCGNSDDGKALKDICLSFALFKLLKRRFLGLACAEARLPKTRHFVLKKLLPSEGEYKRAFKIIEVELGFCYDYFFTRYEFLYALENFSQLPGQELKVPVSLFWFLVFWGSKIISIAAVGVFAFTKSLVIETPNPIIEVHSTNVDYSITQLVVGIALIVQLLQAVFYLASDWVQVSLACRYVKKNCYGPNAFIGKVIGFLRRVTISGAWANKIYQHSILFGKLDPIQVSDTVKRAIATALKSTDGDLTNGETSLRQSQNLSWTLRNHSQLEIMLIWHIATEYCALSEDHINGIGDDLGVAVSLSRYSAYLITSVPELLPYHDVDTKESVREVEDEIGWSFCWYGRKKMNPWSYEELRSVDGTEEEDNPATVFKKGVKLGKQLESMPNGAQRRKVMEEFWAETLLYVAPSHSTTKQHMRHLENGGEFLTHIWALLS